VSHSIYDIHSNLSDHALDPSDPKHRELQAILSHLEDDVLGPYTAPGNHQSQSGYATLPLPWTLPTQNPNFSESSFKRVDWDKGGVPSGPPLPDGTPAPFLFNEEIAPQKLAKGLSAASMVVRWRDAHKEQIERGEIEDCLAVMIGKLEAVLAGRPSGTFTGASSCTLLLMRRV